MIKDGNQLGPYNLKQLGELLQSKEINERTHVWREGLHEWQRLSRVPELADLGKKGPTPPEPATEAQTRMMTAEQLRTELEKAKAEGRAPEATQTLARAHQVDHDAATVVANAPKRPTPPPDADAATVASSPKRPGPSDEADAATSVVLPPRSPRPPSEAEAATSVASPPRRPPAPPPDVEGSDEPTPALLTRVAQTKAPNTAPAQGKSALFQDLLAEAVAEIDPEALSPFEHEPTGAFELEASALADELGPRDDALNETYQNAPPGENTRVFMATAGLYRRRRNNRIAAVVAGVFVAGLTTLITLDLTGAYTIPGMGLVYDVTGVKDPNVDRAVARVENQLHDASLPEAERLALRQKLLGLQGERQAPVRPTTQPKAPEPIAASSTPPSTGSLAVDIFSDSRKKEVGIKLVDPGEIQTPNLPSGLTQEAIYKVINDNARSMKLCLEEAFKKGDKPQGKMEMQVTIAPAGTVMDAEVKTPQFRTSVVGSCTIRRIKGWKFPRFVGEPVTVEFPYVLSAGF